MTETKNVGNAFANAVADILWEEPFIQEFAKLIHLSYDIAQEKLKEGESMRAPVFGKRNQVTYTKKNGKLEYKIDKPNDTFIQFEIKP